MTFVHAVAQAGFATGTNELYDRCAPEPSLALSCIHSRSARPGYQASVLEHIRKALRKPGPYNIVEIGAGTGIFTRAILGDPEWNPLIGEYIAVEPSAGMRSVFEQSLSDKRIRVQDGTFQSTGVETGWADLIIIAQAYHWCPDYNLASAEFARILKPQGTVAYVWNLEDREAARWVAHVRNTIEQYENNSPQFRLFLWRQTFDTPSYKEFFEAPEEFVWSYSLVGTEETVVNRACSKSYIAVLSPEEKEDVCRRIRDILEAGEDKEWIDKAAGTFHYPYQSWVVVAQKK